MLKKYRSAVWRYCIPLFIIPTAYLAPSWAFFHHPEWVDHAIQGILLMIPLCLFFLLTKLPESSMQHATPKLSSWFKVMIAIVSIEIAFYVFSYSVGVTFFAPTGSLTPVYQMHFAFSPIWFGLWCYFALFTVIQHYYYHTEKHAPPSSAAIFALKNNYANSSLKRGFPLAAMGSNIFVIHLLVALLCFFALTIQFQHMVLRLNIPVIIAFCILCFIAAATSISLFKKLCLAIRFRNFVFIGIAALLSYWLISSFYPVNEIILEEHKTIAALANSLLPSKPSSAVFHAFIYGFFLLATSLVSSLIVKFSKPFSCKQLLIMLLILPVTSFLCQYITELNIFIRTGWLLLIAPIFSVVFILLFSLQADTSDFLTGALKMPKQSIIIPTNPLFVFIPHIIMPPAIIVMILNTGPQTIANLMLTGGLVVFAISVITVCAFYGRVRRVEEIS